jgi:sugar lactone lactonase YvrE
MAPCPARMRPALFLSPIFLALALATSGCGDNNVGNAQSVAALAGAAGGAGYFDGTGSLVRFSSPSGVAVVGTTLFIADTENHVIRKIDNATGTVSTLAGNAGNPGSTDNTVATSVRFDSPTGIATDGTFLFVTDTGNHTIRKIVVSSGATTTLAGSAGNPGSTDNTVATNVRFDSPTGIAFDRSSASLFVADTGNHTIRQVTLTGSTTTFAGTAGVSGFANGTGPGAQFAFPQGVAVIGTTVYIADTGNHVIRQAARSGIVGDVTTLAGVPGSPGSGDTAPGPAQFNNPGGIATDGTDLYVADTGNNTIRRVTQSGVVTTPAGLAGNAGSADGTGSTARFNSPKGIGTLFSGGSSVFYAADTGNAAIRQVTLAGAVTTVAGNPPQTGSIDGTGTAARFRSPAMGVAVIGDNVFVSDTGNGRIRMITPSGVVSTVPGTAGAFPGPAGIAAIGTTLYVCDNVNHTISSLPAGGGTVTVLAGLAGNAGSSDGSGSAARFSAPQGIATDGTNLFVADTGNSTIRQVTTSGAVTTLAGLAGNPGSTDGNGSTARFNHPTGIAAIAAPLATTLYVADAGNNTLRKINLSGGFSVPVSTFAGTAGTAGFADGSGGSALFSSPSGIAAVSEVLYLADTGNHAVRRISTAGAVTTFVGRADAATTRDGDASQALLNAPTGVAGEPGAIFFTDTNENVIRKILF